MMPFGKHFFFKFDNVVDACHGDNGKFAQVAVDYDWLCVRVGYHAYT